MVVWLIMSACNNKMRPTDTQPQPPEVLIKVDKFKGKCIKCPYYTLDILDSSKAKLNGKRNVPVLGESTFSIKATTYQKLIQTFENSNFTAFKSEYLTNYMDLASTTLYYKGHTVRYHDKAAPAQLLELSKLIDELINTAL